VSVQTNRARAKVASGRHGKYQLDVTACDVADVVRHAGGWLYDRAMAGWDVCVVVTGECDVTPLRILGVRTERTDIPDDATAPIRALAVAASAEAMATTAGLREDVLRALKRGLIEVTLWGDSGGQERSDPGRPFDNGDAGHEGSVRGVESVEHELSAAARAFKAYALRAAGLDEPVGRVETFRRRSTALLAS
jgi:hypothetical protein